MASAGVQTGDSEIIIQSTESTAASNANLSTVPLYIQLLALEEDRGVITNSKAFDCIICLTTIDKDDGVRLRNCLHQFCRDCLRNAIKHCEEADVACPFGDGNSRCESILQDRETRAILSQAEFDQYLIRTLRIAEITARGAIHCKLVNCDGWCICEDGVNEFKCPRCESVNCVSCQVSRYLVWLFSNDVWRNFILRRRSILDGTAKNIRTKSITAIWMIRNEQSFIWMILWSRIWEWNVQNVRFEMADIFSKLIVVLPVWLIVKFYNFPADCHHEAGWMRLVVMFDVPNRNLLGHEASSLGSKWQRRYIRRLPVQIERQSMPSTVRKLPLSTFWRSSHFLVPQRNSRIVLYSIFYKCLVCKSS